MTSTSSTPYGDEVMRDMVSSLRFLVSERRHVQIGVVDHDLLAAAAAIEQLLAPRSESAPIINPAVLPALPGQKALTVTMIRDDGDVQADAAIEAIKAGTSTFHVTNPSRLFFHHLRLRVAMEPALADKIAVYYLTDDEDQNKRWRLVGLGKDDQLRWPPNFEMDLWEKEAQISAVGGPCSPGGPAEKIAAELRRKYG